MPASIPAGEARELTAEQAQRAAPTRRERELLKLRDEATDEVIVKDLDAAIAQERRKAAEKHRGAEYLRLADEAEDPDLREQLEAKAAGLGVKRRALPVAEAQELPVTPASARAVAALKLDAQDQAAWNTLHRMGDLDANAARLVVEAARVDPAAVDRALRLFAGSPAQFERELQRLVSGGKNRAK